MSDEARRFLDGPGGRVLAALLRLRTRRERVEFLRGLRAAASAYVLDDPRPHGDP